MRAVTFSPLIIRKKATQSLILPQKGEIEWRTDSELLALRAQGLDDSPHPPNIWKQYCNAVASLLSPPNLVSQLAQGLMSLRMRPEQTTDNFSLELTACFTRFFNEARFLPSTHWSQGTAWDLLKIEFFEHGLILAVRLELLKEDASKTYMLRVE